MTWPDVTWPGPTLPTRRAETTYWQSMLVTLPIPSGPPPSHELLWFSLRPCQTVDPGSYCQEWEIDRPTATILQAQLHFFWFLLGFLRQNVRSKYAPPRRPNYTLKWRGGEAAPPIYFIFTPSRRGIFWLNIWLWKKKPSKNQKNEIAPAEL